ncbi:MAG: acetone carboxylase subunit gamma [Pseudomonadales bacterium]|nr:acetone carboxylase subunit gamma [Pseudomonadales bacterium]
MTRVRITEYLDIDLATETWCCNRCGHALQPARENYKKGCLIAEREMAEVHPPLVDAAYNFMPHPDYCRLIEFYCPSCGTLIENEYLPPGHPLTHEIELDIDALAARHSQGGD